MKRLQLLRWSGAVLSPRTRLYIPTSRILYSISRAQSTSAALAEESDESPYPKPVDRSTYAHLPSPPLHTASSSAKLAALHARLCLSPKLPLETLARCLIDPSADPHPSFNNSSLAILGNDILGYHTAEMILCRHPRLPATVIFATMNAYCGPGATSALTREWGVENAASPGGEVDPGLLQFTPVEPGTEDIVSSGILVQGGQKIDRKQRVPWARGMTRNMVEENYFGDRTAIDYAWNPELKVQDTAARTKDGITFSDATLNFVRAIFGAVYIHSGKAAAKAFFNAHIASRKLDISKLFEFRQPTKDLYKLCAREGFENPVARIISETGRASRTPVYIVGVFSGKDKLGEAVGASLDEARIRAAVAALKGWYLYSPPDVRVPSDVDGGSKKPWKPILIDGGEVFI